MKMRKLHLMLFLGMIFYQLNAQVNVSVNTCNVITSGASTKCGINLNAGVDHDGNRDPGFRPLSDAILETGSKHLRFPGGKKSLYYAWTADPQNPDPTTQYWTDWYATAAARTPNDLNFDEFMTLCNATGAEPHINVAYNKKDSTLQDIFDEELAAAWVKYSNITKGYGVKYWEIGNEMWNGTNFGSGGSQPKIETTQELADIVISYSNAMKAIDPTIKIGVSWKDNNMQQLINLCGSALDFVTISNYVNGGGNSYDDYKNATNQNLLKVDSSLTLNTVISEFNREDWSNSTWNKINSAGKGIINFDLVGQILKSQKTEYGMMWNTRWFPNTSGVYSGGEFEGLDNANNVLPVIQSFNLWKRFIKDNLVDISSDNYAVVAYAAYDDVTGDLNVFLINKETTAQNVNLSVSSNNIYSSDEVWQYKGIDEWDTIPSLGQIGNVSISNNAITNYSLPSTSITVFKLVSVGVSPSSYCTAGGDGSKNYRVNSLTTTGGKENISFTSNGFPTGGYKYYNCSKLKVEPGDSVTVDFTNGSSYGGCSWVKMWIDWNADGDFDDTGEEVYADGAATTCSNSKSHSVNLTVPSTAVINSTVGMRIVFTDTWYDQPQACGIQATAGVNDFDIEILPPSVAYCAVGGDGSKNYRVGTLSTTGGSKNISFTTGGYPTGGYEHHTATRLEVEPGDSFTIDFTNASSYGGCSRVKMWIDWNGDGDFDDAGEEAYADGAASTCSNSKNHSVNLTVPVNAVLNTIVGMRIVFTDAWSGQPTACGIQATAGAGDFDILVGPSIAYCMAGGDGSKDYRVDSLMTTGGISNINFTSGGYSTGGYEHHSITRLEVEPGDSFTVDFTNGSSNGSCSWVKMWIDWNADGDFDDTGEEVYADGAATTCSNSKSHSVNLTVPTNAVINNTVGMRIVFMDTWNAQPQACGIQATAGVNDFDIEILPPRVVYCSAGGDGSKNYRVGTLTTTGGSKNINFTSGGYPTGGYEHHTATRLEVEPGDSFTIDFTNGSSYGGCSRVKMWVDWNADGDFDDAGEEVYADGAASTCTNSKNHSVNLTVPTNAVLDLIIGMRIVFTDTWSGQPAACGIQATAGVNDFDILVVPTPFGYTKTYYMVSPNHNVKVGANGGEDPFTRPMTTTDQTVQWMFTESSNVGYYHIDCLGGGTLPRIRTDNTTYADMNANTTAGDWTKWSLERVIGKQYYRLTTRTGDYIRLKVVQDGSVKMATGSATDPDTYISFEEVGGSSPPSSSKSVTLGNNIKTTSLIKLYPNPTSNNINIDLTSLKGPVTIKVCNMVGTLVKLQKMTGGAVRILDFTDLSTGIYLLKTENAAGYEEFKIIKK